MRKVSTLSISLEPEYIEALNRIAETVGSKSAAVRELLDRHERSKRQEEMESQYHAYYSDPLAVLSDRTVTEDLLQASTWLRRTQRKRTSKRHAKRKAR